MYNNYINNNQKKIRNQNIDYYSYVNEWKYIVNK